MTNEEKIDFRKSIEDDLEKIIKKLKSDDDTWLIDAKILFNNKIEKDREYLLESVNAGELIYWINNLGKQEDVLRGVYNRLKENNLWNIGPIKLLEKKEI
jgi:hypothetical protein